MMLLGKINQIGDKDKAEEACKYRVLLKAENIITGWLYAGKRNTLKNQDDYKFDIDEPVAVMFVHGTDMREGVILCAYNNDNAPVKEPDLDIEQFTFSDDTLVKYDRKNHLLEVTVKGSGNKINVTADDGEVNVTCKKATIKVSDMCTVDGKLTVKDEAKFEKGVTMDDKLDVTGNIAGSAKVTAKTGIECDADVKAAASTIPISLLTHKHPTAAPGAPSTPIP